MTAPLADDFTAPAFALPPRPLTRIARRRSWAELPVRAWLILTLLISIITIFFVVGQVREALSDRYLIEHGVDVAARFTSVADDPHPKHRPRDEVLPADIDYSFNGQDYHQRFRLDAKPGAYATVGSIFPIKVDPQDPNHWTEQTQPAPWSQELTASGLLIPLVLILIAITLYKRARVLQIFKLGVPAEAQVVEVKQSAIAPGSRMIRLTLPDSRRVLTTLAPANLGAMKKGDRLWVLRLPDAPARIIAAKPYQQ